MSRSINTKLINPSQRQFEWDGSNGGFRYYDKVEKIKVAVELPFSFLVLDTLSSIKGFSDEQQSGYWSNEVRNISKEPITVRAKKGIVAEGIYKEIIGQVIGGKYCQSCYIAFKGEDDKLIIGNISIMGACLSAWIDFRKGKDVFVGAVAVEKMTSAKKGATKYFIPEFSIKEVSPETDTVAKLLDGELQDYLKKYFAKSGVEVAEKENREVMNDNPNDEEIQNDSTTGVPADDLPF